MLPIHLPTVVWLRINPGNDRAQNLSPKTCQPFSVSRFPITSRAMQLFYDDPDGFRDDRWWRNLAAVSRRWDQENSDIDEYANNMNWYTAMAFCNWLSTRLSKSIRLPTETEWRCAVPTISLTHLSEWCINEYDNPSVVDVSSGRHKAIRGEPSGTKKDRSVDFRTAGSPINAYSYVGFRVVMAARRERT